jgi:hypothetical protein
MTPSTDRAYELLREGTGTALSEDRGAGAPLELEAELGLQLPVAVLSPSLLPAIKATSFASLAKTAVVAVASVLVGSAATVSVEHALRPVVVVSRGLKRSASRRSPCPPVPRRWPKRHQRARRQSRLSCPRRGPLEPEQTGGRPGSGPARGGRW